MSRIKQLVAGAVLAAAIMVAAFAVVSSGPASPEPAQARDCSITIRVATGTAPPGTSAAAKYLFYTRKVTLRYSGLVCLFD